MQNLMQKPKWRKASMGCFGPLVVGALLAICVILAVRFVVPSPWNNYLVDASSTLKLFDDPSLDFTIGYPQTWQAITTPHGILADTQGGETINTSAKALIGAPFAASLTIYVANLRSPITLEEIATERQKLFEGKADFKALSIKSDTVDDTPALRYEYTWDDPSPVFGQVPTHSLEVYVVGNRQSYIFQFFGRESNYQEDLFLKMVHSIKFRPN